MARYLYGMLQDCTVCSVLVVNKEPFYKKIKKLAFFLDLRAGLGAGRSRISTAKGTTISRNLVTILTVLPWLISRDLGKRLSCS